MIFFKKTAFFLLCLCAAILSGCANAPSKHVEEGSMTPIVGNREGDVTLVEYYDYECPHCHNEQAILDEVVASNPDVRVVYRVYPILNSTSWYAAKASVAASLQGKFMPFHEALMALNEAPTPSMIDETATRLGLNMGEYREDLNRPQVTAQIEENIQTAGGMTRPTPTILIGSYETTKPIIFNQETNFATLQQAIDEVRPSYGQAENENPS